MRFLTKSESEKLLFFLLSSLSVGAFILFGQLLLSHLTFAPVIFFLYFTIAGFFLGKSIFDLRSTLAFDLTSPRSLEDKFLLFRSRKEKCAIFFVLNLSLRKLPIQKIRRALQILLKILPESAVLTIEFQMPKNCFTSFYIKYEKERVLEQSTELISTIRTNFQNLFGQENVSLLGEEELLYHLSLGIPGKIKGAAIKGKFSIQLKTNTQKALLSWVTIRRLQPKLLQSLKQQITGTSNTCNIILAIKKENTQTALLSSNVILRTNNSDSASKLSKIFATNREDRQIRSTKFLSNLGDVLVRNVFLDKKQVIPFDQAVEKILAFLSLCQDPSVQPANQQFAEISSQVQQIGSQDWKETLHHEAHRLNLSLETEVFRPIEGFSYQFDAKIANTLFKIVPTFNHEEEKTKWLLSHLRYILNIHKATHLVFLPNYLSKEVIDKSTLPRQVLILTSVEKLRGFLQNLTDLPKNAEAKVAAF